MRLCVLTSEFPPKWGGVGNGVHFQTNVYARMGYEIDIITRRQGAGMEIPEQHENITVHEVDWLKLPMFFATSFGKHAVKKLIELGNDHDVVHVHSNMTLLKKSHYREIDPPIVSTMHGTWKGERSELKLKHLSWSIGSLNDLAIMWLSPFFDKYEDYAIKYSNAVTVDSIQEKKAVGARGVENLYDRLLRIPEGVDTEAFHPKNRDRGFLAEYGVEEDEHALLTVARLAGRKGVDLLLRSFKKILKQEPDTKLLIVGIGPLEKKLKRLAVDLGVDDRALFLGRVDFDALEKLYASVDLFVFHSLWEGQGLIIEEAMASGTPCVSSNVGAVPEMIKYGVDGYYHDVGNTDAQAKYVVELLRDEDTRREMARIGRERMVEDWSWYVIAERYDELYHEVMQDEKKLGP